MRRWGEVGVDIGIKEKVSSILQLFAGIVVDMLINLGSSSYSFTFAAAPAPGGVDAGFG